MDCYQYYPEPWYCMEECHPFYQFGRKDAFPGVKVLAKNSHFTMRGGFDITISNNIQNPDKFYNQYEYSQLPYYAYLNLWAADNTVTRATPQYDVVKTVYDPYPVGFKMPAKFAFSGFTTTGWGSNSISEMNVDRLNDEQAYKNNFGYNFWTNSSKTATIYFPVSGYRSFAHGQLGQVGNYGCYWTAGPFDSGHSCSLTFILDAVFTPSKDEKCFGFAVRPVSE